ncbi:MAG: hypothetical protein ACK5F7_11945 [Planctomycetaceae bacterium]
MRTLPRLEEGVAILLVPPPFERELKADVRPGCGCGTRGTGLCHASHGWLLRFTLPADRGWLGERLAPAWQDFRRSSGAGQRPKPQVGPFCGELVGGQATGE